MGIRKILATGFAAAMVLSIVSSSAVADTTGWLGNYKDGWRYYTSDTEYVKKSWKLIDNEWYYFDGDGYTLMDTWEVINGKLYHFGKNGVMETHKWISCGDYQLDEYYEEYVDLNPDYEDVMAEYKDKKLWRFVGDDGAAYTGWRKVGGEWYHFNDEDITLVDTEEEFQDSYAVMTYGFYFDESEEAWYNFDGDGHYRTDGWYYGPGEYEYTNWYYFDADGHALSDWQKIKNKWYFFESDCIDFAKGINGPGYACTDEMYFFYDTYDEDGYSVDWDIYLFKESGEMVTGWYRYHKKWYYSASDGSLYKDRWFKYNNNWYYFNRLGEMVASADNYEIGCKGYDFDSNGVCKNPYAGRKITGWYERKYDTEPYFWYEDGYAWSYIDRNGKKVCGVENYMIGGRAYDFDTLGICKNPFCGRVPE